MLEILRLVIVVAVDITIPASVELNPVWALHNPNTGLPFASMVSWASKQSNMNRALSHLRLVLLKVSENVSTEEHRLVLRDGREASEAWTETSNLVQVRTTSVQYLLNPSRLSHPRPIA